MSDYKKGYALSYLYKSGKNYSINELQQCLGCTFEVLDELLCDLKSNGYLSIEDYQLSVSNKGKCYLIGHNMIENIFKKDRYIMKHIHPELAVSVDYLYIPKDFKL